MLLHQNQIIPTPKGVSQNVNKIRVKNNERKFETITAIDRKRARVYSKLLCSKTAARLCTVCFNKGRQLPLQFPYSAVSERQNDQTQF